MKDETIKNREHSPKISIQGKEWLATNGIGGYSFYPLNKQPCKKYHSLFCASLEAPFGRTNLLSNLEEKIFIDNKYQSLNNASVSIGQNKSLVYCYNLSELKIKREVLLIENENTVLIRYFLEQGTTTKYKISIKPLFALRNHHQLQKRNDIFNREITVSQLQASWKPFGNFPVVHLYSNNGSIDKQWGWQEKYFYSEEEKRGYPAEEDLFWPCQIEAELNSQDPLEIIISLDRNQQPTAVQLLKKESANIALKSATAEEQLKEILKSSAQTFFSRNKNNNNLNLLAGFPWFEYRGRDALISLTGLCLTSGRYREAKEILLHFREQLIDGMIPLWHDTASAETSYESVDTSLWYIQAIERYHSYSHDAQSVRRYFLEPIQEILKCYVRGTIFNIHLDPTGLIEHDGGEVPLTWMDVRYQGQALNPRNGCAVEINALWYNALRSAEDLCGRFSYQEQETLYRQMAEETKQSFESRFCENSKTIIFDSLSAKGNDSSLRPNALYAFSLPYPVLEASKYKNFLAKVKDELVTPVGIRTLSNKDPGYCPAASGHEAARDKAYHNGTAWPHLFTIYWTAIKRAYADNIPSEYQQDLTNFLKTIREKIAEGAVGQLGEFFDGDYPHHSRGAVAQAWSVAEVLRLINEEQ